MSVVLFLTNQCNLKCKYCFVPKCKETMNLDTYIKVINKLKDNNNHLTFFGGEPLLYFDLIKKIVKYNEDNNIELKYNINTNALLLEDEILDYCLEKEFLLNVSLDGTKESNIINRCNEEQFNKILKNIKAAINKKGNVIVNYVIDPSNINNYYEGIKFLVDNQIYTICLMINYEAKWKKTDIEIFEKQQDKVIEFLLENRHVTLLPLESKIESIASNTPVKKCNFGNDNVIVSTKGELYPCMGFVNNKDYLIKEEKQQFKNTVDITKCTNCKYLPYCSNNCMCKYVKVDKESEVDPNCCFEKIFIKSATNFIINKIDNILENL